MSLYEHVYYVYMLVRILAVENMARIGGNVGGGESVKPLMQHFNLIISLPSDSINRLIKLQSEWR